MVTVLLPILANLSVMLTEGDGDDLTTCVPRRFTLFSVTKLVYVNIQFEAYVAAPADLTFAVTLYFQG